MKKQWKQVLVSFIAYIVWAVATSVILFLINGEIINLRIIEINNPQTFLKTIIVFYVLINVIFIPLIKTKKWKKAGIQVFLLYLVITGYEFISEFAIINQEIHNI